MKRLEPAERAVLMAAFARMDVVALGVAIGTLLAAALFMMTAILLVKGAAPGEPIGAHLGLLGVYLPGYTVSWMGGLIGAVWAWVGGFVVGFIWAVLWNLTHVLYIALVMLRAQWWRMLAE